MHTKDYKDIKVSIVIPVYNGATTLPKCLDSVFAQSWTNIEVICVNDCSPDNSLEILNEYASQYSSMRVISHETNKYAGGAYNTGIKAATGDYVCIVDQDDALYSYSVETLVSSSHKGQEDIVLGQWCKVDEKGNKVHQKNGVIGNDLDANIKYALMNGVRILGGLFKPSLFKDNDLYYPEHVNFEDNAICNALIMAAHSILVVDDLVYDYYIDTVGSSSKNASLLSIQQRIYTTDLCIDNCRKYDKEAKYEDLIMYRYLYFTRNTLYMLQHISYKKEANDIAHELQKKVGAIGDNMFYKTCTNEQKEMLLNPVEYVKQCERWRKRQKIHAVIHKIVVLGKKIIGMDPTKSIFSK